MHSGKHRLLSVSGRNDDRWRNAPGVFRKASETFFNFRSLPIFTDISRRLPKCILPLLREVFFLSFEKSHPCCFRTAVSQTGELSSDYQKYMVSAKCLDLDETPNYPVSHLDPNCFTLLTYVKPSETAWTYCLLNVLFYRPNVIFIQTANLHTVPDKVRILTSIESACVISSPNPMFGHLLESSRLDDFNMCWNIGFGDD